MYGDHHVTAVRRLLLALPGVKGVYASSSFRVVEVQYDEKYLSPAQLEAALQEAGYMGDLSIPAETGVAVTQDGSGGQTYFRHTAAFEQTGKSVGFTQQVSYQGRPLWPCPGMGAISSIEEKETHG
jgi:copper chaperone CopZ